MTQPMTSQPVSSQGFILGTKLYDKLKFLALVFIPAISTLYFSLGGVWNLPNVTQVIGSLTAFDTFLGVLLGISTKAYNNSPARYDGAIVITDTDEKILYTLELNSDPEDLAGLDRVVFKIKK